MKNQFGERLDRNGYAESIVGESRSCYVCGRTDRPVQRHEVFHGYNRTKSKNLGLWISVCDLCHGKIHHRNSEIDHWLKCRMQEIAMEHYGWSIEDFRREFGKNYI